MNGIGPAVEVGFNALSPPLRQRRAGSGRFGNVVGTVAHSNDINDINSISVGASINDATYGTEYHWNGKMDDLHIYNRAISSSEVMELYSNP